MSPIYRTYTNWISLNCRRLVGAGAAWLPLLITIHTAASDWRASRRARVRMHPLNEATGALIILHSPWSHRASLRARTSQNSPTLSNRVEVVNPSPPPPPLKHSNLARQSARSHGPKNTGNFVREPEDAELKGVAVKQRLRRRLRSNCRRILRSSYSKQLIRGARERKRESGRERLSIYHVAFDNLFKSSQFIPSRNANVDGYFAFHVTHCCGLMASETGAYIGHWSQRSVIPNSGEEIRAWRTRTEDLIWL